MPPVVGLALVVMAAAPLLVVDTVSYLVSALLIAGVSRPLSRQRDKASRSTLIRDVSEGMRFLFRHPVVRVFTLVNTLMSAAGGAVMALFLVWADRSLAVRAGDWRLGALYLSWGLGGLLGSWLSTRVVARVGATRVPLLVVPLLALVIAATVLAPNWWLGALGVFAWGAGCVVVVLNAITVRQQVTPEELMSRVTTSGRLIAVGLGYTGGAALAGLLSGPLGHLFAMLVGSGFCLLSALVAWVSPLRAMGADDLRPAE